MNLFLASLKTLLLGPVILGAIFVLLIIGYIIYRKGLQKVLPNQALVVVGRKNQKGAEASDGSSAKLPSDIKSVEKAIADDTVEGLGFNIVTSTTWVNPITTTVSKISLEARAANFEAETFDKNKIGVYVKGMMVYKIGDNWGARARAAIRFLDRDKEMSDYVTDLITGQVRAAIGQITVEQLITDRQALMDQVRSEIAADMAKLGLQIDSLTIQDISDNQDYIKNLGAPAAAAAAQAASIAQDQARQQSENAKQAADLEIAKVRRDTEVQVAEMEAEQSKARETAAQAGPLARAEAEAAVVVEQTKIAELEATRAEKLYDSKVRAKADAERYRTEQEALAEQARLDAAAEAKAKAAKKIGEAEAAAIEARGKAEASAIREAAQALAENGSAVIDQRLAEMMPEIVRAAAEPVSAIDNLVVLDGPEGLTKTVTGGLTAAGNTMEQVRALFGKGAPAGPGASGGFEKPSGGSPAPGPGGDRTPPAGGSAADELEPLGSPVSAGDVPDISELVERDGGPLGASALEDGGAIEGDLALEPSEALAQLHENPTLGKLVRGEFSRRDAAQAVAELQSDPEVQAAFRAVARDEELYSQLVSEIPDKFPLNLLKQALDVTRQSVTSED